MQFFLRRLNILKSLLIIKRDTINIEKIFEEFLKMLSCVLDVGVLKVLYIKVTIKNKIFLDTYQVSLKSLVSNGIEELKNL